MVCLYYKILLFIHAGGKCEIAEIACLSEPCQNGGQCQNVGSTFFCQCPTNYTGILCETVLPACYFEPCNPTATCLDHPDSTFSCFCSPGTKGDTCYEEVTACDSAPCYGNSTCVDTPGGFQCLCSSAYTGVCVVCVCVCVYVCGVRVCV